MPSLLRWIFDNPIILIFVIGWILSAVASARQAAQRRAAQRPSGPDTAPSGPVTMPSPSARTTRPAVETKPSAEEIAAAIRRAMGLEPATPARPTPAAHKPATPASPPPRGEPIDYDEAIEPEERSYEEAPQRRAVSYDEVVSERKVYSYEEGRPVRRLVDELANKAAAAKVELAKRETPGAKLSARLLTTRLASGDSRARRRRDAHRILDLARPASAFLAAEVFGPPVALRDEPRGLSS